MTSPGVYVTEIDASEIVPTVSSSTAVFGGDFTKGPVEKYTEITSVDDLIEFYGLPTNLNYNDWYQCYNFLQYGNRLLVSRACNLNGVPVFTNLNFVALSTQEGYGTLPFGISGYGEGEDNEYVIIDFTENIKVGDIICFIDTNDSSIALDKTLTERYLVIDKSDKIKDPLTNKNVMSIKLDRNLEMPEKAKQDAGLEHSSQNDIIQYYLSHNKLCFIREHHNGTCEALTNENAVEVKVTWHTTSAKYISENSNTSKKITGYTAPIDFPKNLSLETLYSQTSKNHDDDPTAKMKIPLRSESTKKDMGVLFKTNTKVLNPDDWDYRDSSGSIAFAKTESKLKFFSRTPGTADALYEVSIALPRDFASNDKEHTGYHCSRYVHEGITVDSLFEYAPALDSAQIAVVIYDLTNDVVKETYICSLDPEEKDAYNNSMFIEKVINRASNCVYVKCNTALPAYVETNIKNFENNGEVTEGPTEKVPNICSYTLVSDYEGKYYGSLLKFWCSSDSEIQADDLLDAYEVFENKDLIDIDIVIANELDDAQSAFNLAKGRKDCIAFMGIPYQTDKDNIGIVAVSRRSADATANIVMYRNSIKYYSSFICLNANYKYQYDRYNDTYRWLNIAGDIAGLRAKTNQDYDPWWASAGLNRGQIKNVVKLAYNPNQTQRGTLYTNGINPIVDFPGQGIVLWGQKTMLNKASSFDRISCRSLFNTIERALAKMSKYQVMEFNDTFTRNRIIAIMKPYLATVQAGRGIQDFMIICDTTNNTPDIISRNQLVVDIYIKPTYVAEMIHLNFINCGVNDFSSVISSNLS